MSRREAESVGEALQTYLARHGLSRRVDQAGVVNAWAALVGTQLASVSAPQGVDGSGTLWVRVKSAAWKQELQLMTPTIIRDLAERGHAVTAIRWTAGADPDFRPAGATQRGATRRTSGGA